MKFATIALLLALATSASAQCTCPCACPSPPPIPGGDCASRGPANLVACCADKASRGVYDRTCPVPSPPPSPSPPNPSVSPSPGPSGLVEVTNTVGSFAYPADAWTDAPVGTGISGPVMINCYGNEVHRFSTSFDDCKSFCTSLMTCFAIEFDADTGDCVPYLQYGWNDVNKGGNVFASAWARVPEEMNIAVPANCAANATYFIL